VRHFEIHEPDDGPRARRPLRGGAPRYHAAVQVRGRAKALNYYLTRQSDWLFNYAERHRAGLRVGTAARTPHEPGRSAPSLKRLGWLPTMTPLSYMPNSRYCVAQRAQ
jgi:hypothetical protein